MQSKPGSFWARLRALREVWLAQLESQAAAGPKPTYEADAQGFRFEWADWTLKLIQSIREATLILKETPAYETMSRERPA